MSESLSPWLSGADLKEIGMSRAAKADWAFVDHARQAVLLTAREKAEFTTDDLYHRIGVLPMSKGSMGAVMSWAAKKHVCADTGRTVKTLRVRGHARKITVWKSLLLKIV